jgi:hypothetical protein
MNCNTITFGVIRASFKVFFCVFQSLSEEA